MTQPMTCSPPRVRQWPSRNIIIRPGPSPSTPQRPAYCFQRPTDHPSSTAVAKASMLCLSDLLHQTHAQVFAPTLTPRRSALGMLLGTSESILSSVAHINYRGLDGAREIKKKRYPSGRSPAIASLLMLSRSLVAAHSHLASPAFVP